MKPTSRRIITITNVTTLLRMDAAKPTPLPVRAELGRIEERFVWFGRRYELCDPSGAVLAILRRGFFQLWRFDLYRDGRLIGTLEKQWGGLGRELYSQADTFLVKLDEDLVDVRTRLLLVAASVLVDMVHFEKPRSGGFLGHRLAR